MCLGLHF
ncbi:UNVERIFIED_CONTAM: hypothetical protein GTU68_033304 [Idotea baltica]|nr:hypothetical protein [Idotea baltica]